MFLVNKEDIHKDQNVMEQDLTKVELCFKC